MNFGTPYVVEQDDAPAFWQIGNLWRVVATGVQTNNAFCMLDQIVTDGGGGGPCTHTHTQHEGLYVVSGHCTFNAGGRTVSADAGTFVSVPRSTQHSFTVDAPDTQLLNFYLPAGFDVLLMGVAHPATKNEPPPPDVPLAPPRLVRQLARDYGQAAVHGMPFIDPAGPDNMMTEPTTDAELLPFDSKATSAPAYWHLGGLWSVLASGEQTGGSYCLIEEAFSRGPVAPPHLHQSADEMFYVLDGHVTFLLGNRIQSAGKGSFVYIPRNTVHGLRIDSVGARLLNLHAPAGFEKSLAILAEPATKFSLPPDGFKSKEVTQERLQGLLDETGTCMLAVADPLNHGRPNL